MRLGNSSRAQISRWIGGLALLLALSGVAVLVWSGPDDLLDRGDKLFSVIGGLVAVVSLVASAMTYRAVTRAASLTETAPAERERQAANDLAAWVERQWRQEASARLLDRPEPLRVRWSSTSRPIAPAPEEVIGAAGPGRVVRLRLGGDVNEVVDKFAQLPHRQLVVVGQPGAGKSVLVLLLTLGLLRRWRPGQPVPVLLNLSSWNPNREHLDAWLARRLVEEYSVLGNRNRYGSGVAGRLVTAGAVLPVLDGLDELPRVRHAAALAGLNNAVGGGRALVVACRTEEYVAAIATTGTTLGRAAVVELEPVDVGAAAIYLPAGQAEGQQRWAAVIAHLRADPPGPLTQALSTPLMVYLARTVYTAPERDPRELCDPRRWTTRGEIEDHLLDAYLPAVYAGGGAPPTTDGPASPSGRPHPAGQARHWLAYLAARMTLLGTRDLAWWHLHRTVGRFALVFGLTVRLAAGIGFGLAFGLTTAFTHGITRGLTYGLTYGLAFGLGLTAGLRFTRWWTAGLVAGTTAGLIAGLGIGFVYGFAEAVAATLEAGFIVGLGVGLITRPGRFPESRPRQIELSAARLLRATATALPIGLISGILLGLVLMLVHGRTVLFAVGLAYGLPFMLGFGVSEAIVMPADDQDAVTPGSLLRGERAATIAQVTAFGLAASLADVLTTSLSHGLKNGLLLGLAAGLAFGLAFGLAAGLAAGVNSPWLRFLSAQGWFALRGKLPWRLMSFLDDAYRRGVLRQVGAVYQFRHARLHDRLASVHLDTTSTHVGGGTPVRPASPRMSRWAIFPS